MKIGLGIWLGSFFPSQANHSTKKNFMVALQNEIFINFGKEVRYNIFDQNRLYAGLGYHMGKPGRIEVGFMSQILQQRNLQQPENHMIIENNSTMVIAYSQALHFFGLQQ